MGAAASHFLRALRGGALRKLVMIGLAALVCSGLAASVANSAALASGRLVGKTLISFGCPGPATEPPCKFLAPVRSRPLFACATLSG